jgi:carbonic anhydrase
VADLNVRRSVRAIVNRSTILEHMIAAGKVGIIGGKHDLASGAVTFFDDTWLHDEATMRVFAGREVLSSAAT